MPTTIDGALMNIKLSGFKSIKSAELDFNNLNVFIGANGSGKSNFISFFQMVNYFLDSTDGLAAYVGKNGGASSLIYFGSTVTNTIEAQLDFNTAKGKNLYSFELGVQQGNRLYFKDERVSYYPHKQTARKMNLPILLGSGGNSSRLLQINGDDNNYSKWHKTTIITIRNIMQKWCFYQFHNTAYDAFIRSASNKNDISFLRSDGGNLSAFLFLLQNSYPGVFSAIINTIKQIAPFINKIELREEYSSPFIRLKWYEKQNDDYFFDASQMSDGTLRAFALVTLLMLPQKPPVICIDEPELGLHPEAINIIGDLIKIASEQSQIILSTQSPKLIDCFDPDDIVVVDRNDAGTCFNRLDAIKLKAWLDEYSISEIWDTNIFGGRP